MRNAMRSTLVALTMTTLIGTVGCSQRNPDIDRVSITPYWTKTDYNPETSWYYTTTVVESAPNAGMWGGQGDGDFLVLERIRWEITETQLIGWRDYEAAVGTEVAAQEGGDQVFKGQPVAIFPVTGHFDIRRTYDPLTGEEGNEIVENTERYWYDREHFRVDWSQNLMLRSNWRVPVLAVADSWVVQQNEPGDPKRWRFDRDDNDKLDYFEFTTRAAFFPDIYAVLGLYGPGHYYDFAPAVIDVRHSFMKVDQNNDYVPLNMPDSVVLVDDNGEEVRNPDGSAQRVDIFDRFGYFTTWDRAVWDPSRGFTSFGEQNFAIRFNVWEKSLNSDGTTIPMEDRTAKPIVWYTNQRHPDQLMGAAQRVADEWNLVFKEMVFHAQPGKYADLDAVPDMFVLHENSCNAGNVETAMATLPASIHIAVRDAVKSDTFDGTIASIQNRISWANSYDNDDKLSTRTDLEQQAKADLERVCSALEYYTSKEVTGGDVNIVPFTYERVGDLRYNIFNGIVEKTTSSWLGVATLLADPKTGEEMKATANLSISSLDRWAFTSDEALRAMAGELDVNDVLYGYDIEAFVTDKLKESRDFTTIRTSDDMRARMERRFTEMGQGENILREISPNHSHERLSKLAGTPIEDVLVSQEDVLGYGAVDLATLDDFGGDLDAAMMDSASPLRNRFNNRSPEVRNRALDIMGVTGIEPLEFIDAFAFGAAMKYRKLAPRERLEAIRSDLYYGVMLHEVGHTIGLRHNFEASGDAVNYGPEWWEIQALPADLDDALSATLGTAHQETVSACLDEVARLREKHEDNTIEMTTQECLGAGHESYSTIMEYNGHWTADLGGLKPYDYQAIKFGYAQLLEVFNNPTVAGRSADEVERWTRLNDWRDIPSQVAPTVDALYDRSYVKYEWDHATTSNVLPDNLVPYRFCTDMYMTDTCRRWDFGPDSRSNASFDLYNYHQRYFFTHFAHERYWDATAGFWFGASWFSAVTRDWGIMDTFTDKMRWYFYHKATDPEFTGSYAEEDLLATAVLGLNHMSHVLSHPAPGDYVQVPNYWAEGLTNNDPATTNRLAQSDIMRPFSWLDQCDANYFTETEDVTTPGSPEPISVPVSGRNGYDLGRIDLGDGRPFALGYENVDSEEWLISYVGTYYSKDYALYSLGDTAAWFPRTDFADPRTFYVSWYRLFPDEVSKLVQDYVTENYADVGMLVDDNGNTVQRDLIDINTGAAPDYTGMKKVVPLVSFNNQYYAAVYAMALMSSPYDGQYDMNNSFIIAVEGAEDDLGLFEELANDPLTADKVVDFVHPVSGRHIRAVENGVAPIAANLVKRANVLKDRFQLLDDCVEGRVDAATVPYCQCAGTYQTRTDPTGATGFGCAAPFLEPPGEGSCADYEIVNRRDRSREIMDDMVDFIDDLRLARSYYGRGI